MAPPRDDTYMHDLAGAYALDALERDEVEAFESHLSECPRCRAEVQEFRETASVLAHAGTAAPEGLWDRIAAELGDPPEDVAAILPFRTSPSPSTTTRRFSTRQWRLGLLAAAAVVTAIIGVNTATLVRQNNQISDLRTAQSIANLRVAAQRAQMDPTSLTARLAAPDGGVAGDAVVQRNGSGYVIADLTKLAAGQTYQLWGLANGAKPVSLGVLGRTVEVASFTAKSGFAKLAVTIEQAGGAVAPTTSPVLIGELSSQ